MRGQQRETFVPVRGQRRRRIRPAQCQQADRSNRGRCRTIRAPCDRHKKPAAIDPRKRPAVRDRSNAVMIALRDLTHNRATAQPAHSTRSKLKPELRRAELGSQAAVLREKFKKVARLPQTAVGFAQQRGTNQRSFMFSRHGHSPRKGKNADGRYHTTPKSAHESSHNIARMSTTKSGESVAGFAGEAGPAKRPERSQRCTSPAERREREPGRSPAKRRQPREAARARARAEPREAA